MPVALLAALLLAPAAAPPCDVLEEFTIGTDEGPIIVPVTIAGKPYPFLLDTGASCSGYDRSLRHLMGKEVEKRAVRATGGLVETSFCMPPDAKLGQLPLPRDVPAMLVDLAPFHKRLGAKFFGVLGMDFLADYVVQIDCERGKATIRRRPPPDAGVPVILKRNEGKTPVIDVDLHFLLKSLASACRAGQVQQSGRDRGRGD